MDAFPLPLCYVSGLKELKTPPLFFVALKEIMFYRAASALFEMNYNPLVIEPFWESHRNELKSIE